jgi:hypothetical protein
VVPRHRRDHQRPGEPPATATTTDPGERHPTTRTRTLSDSYPSLLASSRLCYLSSTND